MPATPATPTTREEKFAYYYALGYGATDAARLAGYASTTIRGGAYRLAQKPAIRRAVSLYRQSLGFIDSHLLAYCLDQYKRIAADENAKPAERFKALKLLVELRLRIQAQAESIPASIPISIYRSGQAEPFPHKSPANTNPEIS